MIDGAPLILLGMGAVSLLTLILGRRKRQLPSTPTPLALSGMSSEELAVALAELRPDLSHREVRETVKVLLIHCELERIKPLKPRQ